LPDGRTQVVNYEVHPERGYEAKITYEGEAQYPDTPGYVPTPYGPPEPLRPGYDKFKRESVLLGDDVGNDEQVREVRKVEIQYSNNGHHHGRKHKKPEPEATLDSELLVAEPSEINVQDDQVDTSAKVKEAKNHHKKYDPAVEKKGVNEDKVRKEVIVQETEEDFYDTEHSPQAEPLSLQQNNPQKSNKKKEVRIEYKPETLKKSDKDILKIEKQQDVVFVPLIYEAVPTPTLDLDIKSDSERKTEENLLDDIYTDFNLDVDKKSGNVNAELLTDPDSVQDVVSDRSRDILSDAASSRLTDPVYSQSADGQLGAPVTGIQIELISPPDVVSDHLTGSATPNYRQKNHQKRKIDIKDYDRVIAANPDPYKYIIKQEYPTLYRSQANFNQKQLQTKYQEEVNEVQQNQNIFDLMTGEEYEQFYQTIFAEPRPVAKKNPILRKARIPKKFNFSFIEPQYYPVHTESGVKLVNSDVGFVPASA